MYIHPFVCGVFATLIAEIAIMFAIAFSKKNRG
jgi:hypothetical protein